MIRKRRAATPSLLDSISIVPKEKRIKVAGVAGVQILLGVFDLVGVMTIGLLGALAVSGIGSRAPGNRVSSVLNFLGLTGYSFQTQVAVLGFSAALILVAKTLMSVFFLRRTYFFLARTSASISASLVAKLLSKPLLTIQKRTVQESLWALTTGVSTILLGVVGTLISLISDISLLAIMAIGLFVVDPVIAFSTFFVFSIIGYLLYLLMHIRARDLGRKNVELSIASAEKIVEVLTSYRELLVRNRRGYYSSLIGKVQLDQASTQAEMQFMPNISKYVIESTVVLGALAISAVQFLRADAIHAVATLSVFLAAGTRIAPAVLRVQQAAVGIRGSIGSAAPTLLLIKELHDAVPVEIGEDVVDTVHEGFKATVEIKNLKFKYPGNLDDAISDINLSIPQGCIVAFVGPSGAGKTTLVDLLLGILVADSGEIQVSGVSPLDAISKWPGAIAYVPQDVVITSGSVTENVGLGFSSKAIDLNLVEEALEAAQLREFVQSLPDGLASQVGERGTRISGGQRQRLGIARALFTKPKLLILDEATSALDGQTEADISASIVGLKGQSTVLMIAHRLSTVKSADLVAYIDQGQLIKLGTFDEVRSAVPDFDKQAKLMGL